MGNEMFQARLDDDFASDVHEYREARHMSKSEVVRAGLRELVGPDETDDGTDTTDADESAATNGTGGTSVIEKGYQSTKQLADTGMVMLMVALGASVAVTVGVAPPTAGTIVVTVTLAFAGTVATFASLALYAGLQAAEAAMNVEVDNGLRRLDLRRVVAA